MKTEPCYACKTPIPILEMKDGKYSFRCSKCNCATKYDDLLLALEAWNEGHTFPPRCVDCKHGDGTFHPCGKQWNTTFLLLCSEFEEKKLPMAEKNKNNQEENKMTYENEIDCGRVTGSPKPVEDLTDMLNETRAMAQEAGKLADKIGNHLFGNREGVVCCGEAKCAEPANFRDALSEVRTSLKCTIDDLAKMCTLIGV